MPQDKRRSIRYRSFVTCDDPKGVVECGAIRRNQVISPQKKEENIKFEVEKMKVEKKEIMKKSEITRELNAPSSSFQLLQVSKGANKLNHVINSWSKSNNNYVENQHNEIARDLLKGALDLQESLAVLRKLQEGSNRAPPLMKKHKQKLDYEGRFDGMVKGVMDESLYVEFQNPSCVSIDGLPRKSFDEMRKVVRDSLLRQNVITNPIFEEHFEHNRRFGYSHDMPSTSSSQSSMIHPISNIAPQRKNSKESNLIVKLMGLESFPSSPRKHKESDKIVNMEKPVYDIDSPRARKSQLGGGIEIGGRQRSVDEIFETLNFKGLLRSNSGHGMMAESPPIVLIKPMRFSTQIPNNVEDNCASSRVKETLMKLRSRGAMSQSSPSENWKEDDEVDFEARSKFIKKVAASEIRSSYDSLRKLQRKKASAKKAGEVGEVDPNRSKAAKSSQLMRSRDQAKSTASKVKKQRSENDQKLQNNTSTAILHCRTCQSVEGSGQRVKTRQPPVLTGRRGRQKNESKEIVGVVKKEIESTSENDPVLPTTDNFHSEMQAEPSQIQITDYDDQSSVSDTREAVTHIHNDESASVCDEKLIRTYEDNNGYRLHLEDNKSPPSDITSLSIPELAHLNENHITTPEVTLVTTHENGVAVILDTLDEESDTAHLGDHTEPNEETQTKYMDPRTKLKALLLSNPSFVNRAEELFGLQLNISILPCVNEGELTNNTMLLDCANEVMELKSLQLSQSCYLPLPKMCAIINPRIFSLDKLLDEVCDRVDELRSYLTPTDDDNVSSDVYVLQDRDMKFNSATWDIGWRDVFSKEDVEKVIGDIDKLVLGKLVEEVIVDLML